MRRTVTIDDALLAEARRVLGTATIRETVAVALSEAVRRHRLEELRAALGTFDLDLTADELADLRADD